MRGSKLEETEEERGIEIGRGRVGGESTFQNCRATNASRETKYLACEQAFGRTGNLPFLAIFFPKQRACSQATKYPFHFSLMFLANST